MHAQNTTTRRRGIMGLWMAIMTGTFLLFLGFALDFSYVLLTGYELQDAADAASLAGAMCVKTDTSQARDWAVRIANDNVAARQPVLVSRNDGNSADGDVVVGRFFSDTGVFDPTSSWPNAVQVVARRTETSLGGPLDLLFAPIVGLDHANVARLALAVCRGGTGKGLIVLNLEDDCSLDIRGTVALHVNCGAVHVNSSSPTAACSSGQPMIDAPDVNVVGDVDMPNAEITGEINIDQPVLLDPLRDLPDPTWDPASDLGTVRITGADTETVFLGPGYYSGGIQMTNNLGRLELSPGVYVLDGAGLDVTGGTMIAEGVMFYVIDTTPSDSPDSHVYLGGNANLTITPIDFDRFSYPPELAVYEGVAIFQARDNTNEATIIGTNDTYLEGAYYFPENHLNIGGTSDALGNQLIADTMYIHGTGDLTINYTGDDTAAGNEVFLIR